MKSKCILMSNQCDNNSVMFIQRRLLPLKRKLKNFCMLISFTLFLLLIGFPILFLSWRNKGQYECVPIVGMLIKLVQNTIIPLPLSTRLLMNVMDVKYSHLWTTFPAIIRSISTQRTNLKLLLYVHGAHSLTWNSLLVWRTQGRLFRGK